MHIQATVHTFRCCDILIAFPSSGAEFFRSSLRVIDNSLRLRQHPVLALLAVDFSNQADVVNEVSAAVCVKLNRHLDNEAARWRWRPGGQESDCFALTDSPSGEYYDAVSIGS
jgi:hypothetical protein